jgi:TPR repeat protein
MYLEQKGGQADIKQAVDWFRKAAEQGHAKAQYQLGELYRKGQGVEQDFKLAAKWYRKAAERGIPQAQLFLGVFYTHGQGVTADPVEAYVWFQVAGSNGLDVAQNLKDLQSRLTSEQIAEAKRRITEYAAKAME